MGFNKSEAMQQAQQFMRQGSISAAITVYRKIVEAEPSDLVAITTLGDLYIKTGRVEDAVDNFSRIAESYLRSGSDISARYILNKILKLDPENPSAQMQMAELLLRQGNDEKAHESFIDAGAAFWHKGDVKAAIEANQRALAVNPNSRQAKAALAAMEQEMQPREPEPLPAPKPIITVDLEPILISVADDHEIPDAEGASDPPLPARLTATNYDDQPLQPELLPALDDAIIIEKLANAELLAGYGQTDEAVATLREILQRRPDHIEVRLKLMDIYLRAERTDRASEECVNIAGIFAARGEATRTRDYLIRAQLLCQATESANTFSDLSRVHTDNLEDARRVDSPNHISNT